MASIRRMVLAGSKMTGKTVDVLDGDRHDVLKNKNNYSWYDMEQMWMNPITFGRYYGHPKRPWYTGNWKFHEGVNLWGQTSADRIERRLSRGSAVTYPVLEHMKEAPKEKKKKKKK